MFKTKFILPKFLPLSVRYTLLLPPSFSGFLSWQDSSLSTITAKNILPELAPKHTIVFLCKAASRSSTCKCLNLIVNHIIQAESLTVDCSGSHVWRVPCTPCMLKTPFPEFEKRVLVGALQPQQKTTFFVPIQLFHFFSVSQKSLSRPTNSFPHFYILVVFIYY